MSGMKRHKKENCLQKKGRQKTTNRGLRVTATLVIRKGIEMLIVGLIKKGKEK